MTELISEEEWETDKFLAWSRLHNLRSMTTSDLNVSNEDQNIVALMVGERMFLNADFIESLNGRYDQKSEEKPEEKPEEDDGLEPA